MHKFVEFVKCARPLAAVAVAASLVTPLAHAEDADTLPDHASPSACVVIIRLALQSSAIDDERIDLFEEAEKTFREKSVELNDGTEGSNQMIGSSVAFFDGLTQDKLQEGAEMCLSAVEDDFEADE